MFVDSFIFSIFQYCHRISSYSRGGVIFNTLMQIVNLRRARLVLRWAILYGVNSRYRTFRYVTNQPPKVNSAFHPSWVGKWVPSSAGKAKAGMVHSVSGWTRGVQIKLWDPLRTRAIPEHLRGVYTTRRYTNPRLPLPLPSFSFLPNLCILFRRVITFHMTHLICMCVCMYVCNAITFRSLDIERSFSVCR